MLVKGATGENCIEMSDMFRRVYSRLDFGYSKRVTGIDGLSTADKKAHPVSLSHSFRQILLRDDLPSQHKSTGLLCYTISDNNLDGNKNMLNLNRAINR